jgi:hypothetical protein
MIVLRKLAFREEIVDLNSGHISLTKFRYTKGLSIHFYF